MPTRLTLNGPWKFAEAKLGAKTAPRGGWLPARVPGDVHLDLVSAGKLKDPLTANHESEAGWVEQREWWYKRSFHADKEQLAAGGWVLVAEGLDTWCTLWLNGKRLGRTQNSFVEHEFDVKRLLKPGVNELLLRFEAPMQVLKALEAKHGVRPAVGEALRVHGRKASYSFGWDWAPRLPGVGVFRDIYLEQRPALRIADLWVRTLTADAREASGELCLELDSSKAQSAPLSVSLGPWSYQGIHKVAKGRTTLRLKWALAKPKLWWPAGWGEAHLYQVEARIGQGQLVKRSVGVRTIALDQSKDRWGRNFGFMVNGKAVYAKGTNWVPADSFLSQTSDGRIEKLLELAKTGNQNMIRVWGGGIYESEAFYEACDRLGLLVWQDFLFSCSEMPEHPDFLAEVKREAELVLRRLRGHASLALLCGNNENYMARHHNWFRGRQAKTWGPKIYEKVLPEVCGRLAPEVEYWPGSPYGGKDSNSEAEGDRHHWEVWAFEKDPDHYLGDKGRFLSEFGLAAFPNRHALHSALPKDERWLQSRTLQMHDKVERGGGVARLARYIIRHLPMASGLDNFRYLSQVMQSVALRTGIEHWRRLKPRNQGTLVWQLNDCWPVMSWSLIDYDLAPKLGFWGVRRAFNPILLSSTESGARMMGDVVGVLPLKASEEGGLCEVWMTLDGPQAQKGRLIVERWNMKGWEARLASIPVSVPANGNQRLWAKSRKECGITDPATQYLVYFYEGKDATQRRVIQLLERPMRLDLVDAKLVVGARAKDATIEMAVQSRSLALACEMHAPVKGSFSDNGFDLLPGETRKLEFTPSKPGKIKGAWQVLTLNQMQREARRG